jgi:hypothetical protein
MHSISLEETSNDRLLSSYNNISDFSSSCMCLGSVFTRFFFKSPYEFHIKIELLAGTNYFNAELSKSNRTMREFPPHRKTQFPLLYISKILVGRGLETGDWSSSLTKSPKIPLAANCTHLFDEAPFLVTQCRRRRWSVMLIIVLVCSKRHHSLV